MNVSRTVKIQVEYTEKEKAGIVFIDEADTKTVAYFSVENGIRVHTLGVQVTPQIRELVCAAYHYLAETGAAQ